MNLEPTYVTFEQAKLLKEKGFAHHELFQDFADYYDYYDRTVQGRLHVSDFSEDTFPDNKWIPVPEQWQVIEWLRVVHGIWIYAEKGKASNNYGYRIQDINGNKSCYEVNFKKITPQEAYSVAIDYTLNNLI